MGIWHPGFTRAVGLLPEVHGRRVGFVDSAREENRASAVVEIYLKTGAMPTHPSALHTRARPYLLSRH